MKKLCKFHHWNKNYPQTDIEREVGVLSLKVHMSKEKTRYRASQFIVKRIYLYCQATQQFARPCGLSNTYVVLFEGTTDAWSFRKNDSRFNLGVLFFFFLSPSCLIVFWFQSSFFAYCTLTRSDYDLQLIIAVFSFKNCIAVIAHFCSYRNYTATLRVLFDYAHRTKWITRNLLREFGLVDNFMKFKS